MTDMLMNNRKQSVLVTGASSGIGKECALHLEKMGFLVFAGVRTAMDQKRLKTEASGMLQPIILDVTKSESISNAAGLIFAQKEYPLFGLVNNAGIGLRGVLEATPITEVRKMLEVNVIGLYAVTKEFLPLLRSHRGRIVNIGSENSFTAGPNGSAYAASKFAVRAISDSLRLEMVPFGVSVSLIAPTSTESNTWDKLKVYRDKLRASVKPEILDAYKYFFDFEDENVTVENLKPIPAADVADVVAHALTAKKPGYEYPVGANAEKAYKLSQRSKKHYINKMIKKLTDSMSLK